MVGGEAVRAAGGVDAATLPVYHLESLNRPEIVHGVTTRTPELPLHGNMSYMVGDAPDLVRQNRVSWASAIGYDHARLVLGRQVHGTTVAVVDERHAGSGADSVDSSIQRVDALVTSTLNLPIGVMAADCVPVLMYDPVKRAVAAVHAGWRGTVDGIIPEAIGVMRCEFGSAPKDLIVGFGPAICQECYQVGPEVIERWRENRIAGETDAVRQDPSGLYFDLREANRAQALDAGVSHSRIEISNVCTRCSNGGMFSRRGLGPRTGLFTSVIMLSDCKHQGRDDQ